MSSTLVGFNIWLDVLLFWIWMAAIAFVIFHFTLSMFKLPRGSEKSRFRKSFIEGKWPEHESRAPVAPKVAHGLHMVAIILLAITGMYIRFPTLFGARDFMRNTHYVFMTIAILTFVWRIWYAFFSKKRDYKEFAIGKKDIGSLLGVLAYYGYFTNNKPHVAKYNCAQKASYMLFVFMMLAQIFTGLVLVRYNIIFGHSPANLLLGYWVGPFVGGAAMSLWYARMLHYILNWLFIIMMTIHFYLAASVDVPCTLDFFGLTTMPTTGGHGHDDDHGEEAPAPESPGIIPAPVANPAAAIGQAFNDPELAPEHQI
jgi:Ni/Fe-hydrogenase 1 B-type cytochrome subunit